ncbi:endolytic transglycosylase MltG, partial [Candidatus Gracilibacteria bacterium]|nr:endolytic transglycosylase MltG [Candidatus Gracilibacteria bacterium]
MKKLILLIILIVPIYFVYSYNSFKSTILTSEEQTLEIKKGDTYRSLANKFDLNANYLKAYLKLNPPSKDLQAGNYKLKKGLNIDGVIESLKNPITNDKQITILEGWNIYDIDNLLSKDDYIKAGDLISLNKEKLDKYKKEYAFLSSTETLEGFLYPDTYSINPNNFKLEDFIKTMLENFDKKVITELEINPKDTDLYDNIILASIVEKEEKSVKEKATVAGVLKKRMKENWFIGADATVCYPYELTFDECTPAFIGNHIQDKNEYNTRNKLGLPKTPICNPSANS